MNIAPELIDPEIRDIVVAMNSSGYMQTTSSCSGNCFWNNPYHEGRPYVEIQPTAPVAHEFINRLAGCVNDMREDGEFFAQVEQRPSNRIMISGEYVGLKEGKEIKKKTMRFWDNVKYATERLLAEYKPVPTN